MNAVRDIDILKTWLLSDSLNFTRYFFKSRYHRKFVVGQHHRMIADALNKVYTGETKKLIINIAPRYGKTEQAVKNFIANGLALNPKAKFIHLSYSDDLARDNSRGVQEIMRDPEFQRLFDAKPTSPNTKKWFTRQGGGLYAVSSAGQVTGFGAGLVDEVKNAESDKDLNEALDEFMPEVVMTQSSRMTRFPPWFVTRSTTSSTRPSRTVSIPGTPRLSSSCSVCTNKTFADSL